MRALGVAWLASALACGSGNESGTARIEGYRSKSPHHTVQVDARKAAEWEQRGAKVLGDYGAYKLVQVDDALLDSLPSAQGAELRDDYAHILLNAGVIDTTSEHARTQRGVRKLAAGAKGLHLVHFNGPVRAEWLQELASTGVKVVTYIPNNAYLVYGDSATLSNLQRHITASPVISWDGEYLNDYKLDPAVQAAVVPAYHIQLVKDDQANAETLALIRKLQKTESNVRQVLDYVNVTAPVDRQALYEIVQRPDVISIQPAPAKHKLDERQNMIISGQLTGNQPQAPNWLAWLESKGFNQQQFTTSGFAVDVTDSGLDNGTTTPNHFGLYTGGNIANPSRVRYVRLEGTPTTGSTLSGCNGHGTLNTHIVGGFSNQGGVHVDSSGYHYGLGVAPFVKLANSVIFDPNYTDPNYTNMLARGYRDDVRISTNSWGASNAAYTVDSQEYDALVRDAQPATGAVPADGNQQMVVAFAAGNDGPTARTVGEPGTAKNVITVGASENVQAFGGPDKCATGDTEADGAFDVASFSSRGPTADGRKKPDIMAPGTHVSGGVAQTAGQRANPPAVPTGEAISCFTTGVCGGPSNSLFFPTTQQWYSASTGTSHSTPAVAGGTALLRQYFLNQSLVAPSPAMTKAFLMNSARYMTGTSANDSLYSNNQGMGLMDLGMAFDGTPRLLDDQVAANLFTATGQTRTFKGVVADSTKPFRVTVAWSDAPGATTGSAWKNNLDLTVTVGTNSYKGNVFTGATSTTGGSADVSNNVESVFLPAGLEGDYTVTMTATNINSDGVPNNTSSLDQDFALVAYNSCTQATPVPAGVSAQQAGDNRIAVSWTENGAASYNIYRATTAGGPYVRVGSSVTSPFADVSVSGGTTYYYVVRAVLCAESARSAEVSAAATGVCTLTPTFAGLTSATNAAQSTCANTLTWSAATPACNGTVSYSVYRSATADFTPSGANRIATGVSATTFSDSLYLANGKTYYYVVRATETAAATLEETNTVRKSAAPSGAYTAGVLFDDFDGNRPPNASAYWIPTVLSGTAATTAIVNCRYQSPTQAYRMGAPNTTCGTTNQYLVNQSHVLVLGGNGASGINGIKLLTDPAQTRLTFNVWYDLESRYDGAWLVYSTTGATGPWINVGDAVTTTAPYISAGGYDDTLSSASTTRIWTGALTNANGALKPVTVNMSALAGQTVWIGYRFSSDSTQNKEGFYLDDVRLPASIPAVCTTNTPPPGPAVAYQLALPVLAQVGRPATINITALDSVGQTATGYSGTAALTSSDSAAVLPGPVTFNAGVANGLSATFNTGGNQTVTATDTVAPAVKGSGSLFVTTATKLAFSAQPATAVAGSTLGTVRVQVTNDSGMAVTTGSFNVTLTIANNPGGGALSGTTTVTTVSGVATFTGLSIDKVGAGYTLKASSPLLADATSTPFNITAGTAARLGFLTQPTTTVAGAPITPAVRLAVQDQYGNNVTTAANVTVALVGGAGTLSGTTTAATVDGVATFSNLSVDKVGTDYTLRATSGTLTAVTSTAFAVTPAVPYRLRITTQPSNVAAGAAITPAVKVTVYDRFDNLATQATNAVSLLLGTNPGGALLSGTTKASAVAGVATFDAVSVSRAGANYTLVASASGLFQDTSVSFDVSEGPPSAARLAFKTGPASATVGSPLAAIEVELRDAQGNLLTNVSALVTLTLGTSPTEGQLFGNTSATAVNGVARFEGLSLRKAGKYTLVADAQGFKSVTSAEFDVTSGPATRLALRFPASVTSGQQATLSATAYDAYGNVATSYTGPANVTSSDPAATLPASTPFVAGVLADLKVTFNSSGLRTLTLTDAAQSTLSGSVQTNVTPFAQPTVAVTSPAGGTEVSGAVSITATGVVAAGTALRQISILVDGVAVGSGTASPFTATWDASKAINGSTHTFTAIITDASGGVGNSAPVSVTVTGGVNPGDGNTGGHCGCGATSGADASLYLGLFALARYVSVRRRQAKKAA